MRAFRPQAKVPRVFHIRQVLEDALLLVELEAYLCDDEPYEEEAQEEVPVQQIDGPIYQNAQVISNGPVEHQVNPFTSVLEHSLGNNWFLAVHDNQAYIFRVEASLENVGLIVINPVFRNSRTLQSLTLNR